MGQLELKTSGQLEETFGSFPQSWCRPKEGAVGRQCYGQADSDTMSVSEGQREALQVWEGKGNCWVVCHLTPQATSGDSLTPNRGSC